MELYIEMLLPHWIQPIASWNVAMLPTNLILIVLVLAQSTINYDRAF